MERLDLHSLTLDTWREHSVWNGGGSGLRFIGAANVAAVWWCPMKAVLESREEEAQFFLSYIEDLAQTWSKDLDPAFVFDPLHAEHRRKFDALNTSRTRRRFRKVARQTREVSANDATRWLPDDVRATWDRRIVSSGSTLPKCDDPKVLGLVAQGIVAEHYPTFRWHFALRLESDDDETLHSALESYCIAAVPDGLTHDGVYEFKTSAPYWLLRGMLQTALAQADLYGLFFERERKRVQLLEKGPNLIHTLDLPVDRANAMRSLVMFARADVRAEFDPPHESKCRSCRFQTVCAVGIERAPSLRPSR